jgi:hypothetical protein
VIEAVAAYVKKVDPNHPTMTVVAQSEHAMQMVRDKCPSIDILGCNSYGGISKLAKQIRESGLNKPYIVSEWGVDGSWEVNKTSWGAALEPSSTDKARIWSDRHELIAGDIGKCLGGYAFYWGHKQETTPTWFGIFLEDGSRTELLESLQSAWSGKYPETRAPRIGKYRINRKQPKANLVLRSGRKAKADFELLMPDPQGVRIRWELIPESLKTGIGGDREERPQSEALKVLKQDGTMLRFEVPAKPGPYRLFLYVYGEADTVASANFPFLVK